MGDKRELILSALVDSFIQNSSSKPCYSTFLSVLLDGQLLGCKNAGTVGEVTSQINSLLVTSKGRLEGLCLLDRTLQQCTTETFLHNCSTWTRLLLATLQSHDPPLTFRMSCHVTGELLKYGSKFPEQSRELSSSILPQILTALLDTTEERIPSSIECLNSCMRYFSGSCGPFKNKIEQLAVNALFNRQDENLVQLACTCYGLLAGCGGGGNQGIKHTEAWTVQCDRLLGTLHLTLKELFTGAGLYENADSTEYKVPTGRLERPLLPEAEPQRTYILVEHSAALFRCLSCMLSSEFKSTARIPVETILGILCHALSITGKQLSNRATQEKLYLLSVLPLLQKEALQALSHLVLCVRSHLVIYCGTINQLFLQILNWTSVPRSGYGQCQQYGSLRQTVWATLEIWIKLLGSSSGIEDSADNLLTHLLQEVAPHADTVKLSSKGQAASLPQSGSKKKKLKGLGDIGQLTAHRKIDECADADTCQAALEALVQLQLRVSCFLTPSHHKLIQEFVVPTLLNIQQRAPLDFPIPYSHPGCRRALYHVLLANVLCPHSAYPPPTQCAVGLFSQGLQDSELQVSSFCIEALAVCESIIHPRAPSLNHPVMVPRVPETGVTRQGESISAFSSVSSARDVVNTLSGQPFVNISKSSQPVSLEAEKLDVQTAISKGLDDINNSTEVTSEQSQKSLEKEGNILDTVERYAVDISNDSAEETLSHTVSLSSKPHPSEDTPVEMTCVQGERVESIHGDNPKAGVSLQRDEEEPVMIIRNVGSADDIHGTTQNGEGTEKEADESCYRAEGDPVQHDPKPGLKRKLDDKEEEVVSLKKQEMDEADLMLMDFVDAGPDQD